MYANLMGPPGLEFDVDIRVRGKAFPDRIVRNGWLAVLLHTHAFPINWMSANGFVDRTAAGQNASANGEVVARDLAVSQQSHECRVRGQRLCDQQQATGVLVETMNDAGARDFLELWNAVQ